MTGAARRCSHCGCNGHNSRTCNDRKGCLKLFGVRISADDMDRDTNQHHHLQFHVQDENVPVKNERNEAMQRSLSMGHMAYQQHLDNQHMLINKFNTGENADNDHHHHGDDGYLSDGLTQYSSCKPKIIRRRKKGVPWTEEEHKTFLLGLKKLGRGDWRGISKNFVHTRTPTQVACHAQKYFMRQLSAKDMKKKKKRMSLFDLPLLEDLSLLSPTSPFASLLEESPPPRHGKNFIIGSGDSSDHADFQDAAFPVHHSHALPPLSPQGQAFRELPHMVTLEKLSFPQGCVTSDTHRIDNNYALHEDLLKLNLLSPAAPKQADDTRLQLGLPSFPSPKPGLMSSVVDNMLELRIALPVGLESK